MNKSAQNKAVRGESTKETPFEIKNSRVLKFISLPLWLLLLTKKNSNFFFEMRLFSLFLQQEASGYLISFRESHFA